MNPRWQAWCYALLVASVFCLALSITLIIIE